MSKKKQLVCIILALFSLLCCCEGASNGLGKTPQMGWNTNYLSCSQNETMIANTIDFMKAKNWDKLGYQYILLDDCWQQKARDPVSPIVQADKTRFPLGLKVLASYAHDNGFKFGLYSDSGYLTCDGLPGSYGFEQLDAQVWASWGIDYVKYDNCYTLNVTQSIQERYTVMSNALLATGRPIFFSMCEWGWGFPGPWAPKISNSWRVAGDIPYACWECIITYTLINDMNAPYSGPGGWNDIDMLQVGFFSEPEGRAQYSLWAAMKSPLIQSAPITNLSLFDYETFTNTEVIAVNQDPLGEQARLVDKQYPARIGEYPFVDIPIITACNGGLEQVWAYTSGGHLMEQKNRRYLSCTQGNVPSVLPISNYSSWSFSNGFLICGGRVLSRFDGTQYLVFDTVLNSTTQMFYYNYVDNTIRWAPNPAMCVSPNTDPPLLVFSGRLVNNTNIVALFNPLDSGQYITTRWDKVGLNNSTRCIVRDLWDKFDMGTYNGLYTSLVQPRSVTLLKLIPLKS